MKGKLAWLIKGKEMGGTSISFAVEKPWEDEEYYEVTRIVYFEIQEDTDDY